MNTALEIAPKIGIVAACSGLGVARATFYRAQRPVSVFALLLDAGRYLASVSTFYRLLRASGETRRRRNELTHPAYAKPELL
ncbi:MAG: hypothetical protein ACREXK_11035, partial [Gammaproteobacteria bacterium]